jgi:hypothetical protein
MGFSWNEWQLLRKVSDSGISASHQGRNKEVDSALAALERVPSFKLPAEACKDALKKMLEYVKMEA